MRQVVRSLLIPERGPWGNALGLARTIIALSQVATLVLTAPAHLWVPILGAAGDPPYCYTQPQVYGLYCAVPSLGVARWVAVALLLLVASGWRPRVTGPIHAYVSWSAFVGFNMADGGEQAAAVITLLLLPATLTDPRKWHWSEQPEDTQAVNRSIASASIWLVRLQACVIYFHALVGKLVIEEWAEGTVLYYWLIHPTFGCPDWMWTLLEPVIYSPRLLPLCTWAVLLAEFLLAAGIVASKRARYALLGVGFALHGGIILLHSITSFSIVMLGLLILYLYPLEVQVDWKSIWSELRAQLPSKGSDAPA